MFLRGSLPPQNVRPRSPIALWNSAAWAEWSAVPHVVVALLENDHGMGVGGRCLLHLDL